jgi:two-component system cell cycle sensor histidine kinase/response regulator CckA
MVDTHTNSGKAAFVGALAAVVVGACVLAGWPFELEFLKRVIPGFNAMNPVTAVAFILYGASLALFLQGLGGDQKARAMILTARLCALAVTLIGLAKIVGILSGWDLGVDGWLFASKLPDGPRFPDRMAPNAALNFLLLGSALAFVDVKSRSVRFCAELSVIVVGFVSLLAVLGYAYDIRVFYGFGLFSPMALHTAITFLVLAAAFLLSHTDSGLLAVFAGDSAGGTMARRLLPAAVLVPSALGWLTLQGEKAGIYEGEFGAAVFAMGNILVFTFLICWNARGLFTADLRRKKAEEAMRESEKRFSGAFEHAPIGVALIAPDGQWLKVNRALCELVGYSEAELLALTFQDITHPEDLEDSLENVRRLVAGEIRSYQIEKRYLHGRGHFVTVLLNVSLVRDGLGEPRYFIAQIQDITSRKEAEVKIRFNEQRYRSLVEATTAIVWDMPASGEFEVEQRHWTAFTGQSFEELRGWGWLNSIHPDDQAETARVWSAAVASRSLYEVEHRLRARDGIYRDMMVRAVPILAEDGTVQQFIGIHIDITERKRATEHLAANEALLRLFIQHTPVAIAMLDTQMRYVQISERWMEDYHLVGQEIIGKSHYEIFPDMPQRWIDIHQRVLAGAIERCDEDPLLRADGTTEWLQWEARPWRNADGEIGGLIFFTQIITERKHAEEELRWKTAFLEALLNSTLDGTLVVDQQAKKILQNQRLNDLLKIPRHIADNNDDEQQLRWVTGMAKNPGQFIEKVVYLNAHPNETSRDEIELKGGMILDRYSSPVLGKDGKYYGRIWTFRDITEQRRAEESIRVQAHMLDNIGQAVIATDLGGQVTYANHFADELYGWPPAEMLGQNIVDITVPQTTREQAEQVLARVHRGENWSGEFLVRHRDGTEFPAFVTNTPLRDQQGKVIGIVGITKDITERKRLEIQLFQAQKMETVGKLAGGVAHEFNSIMTTVIGQSELMLNRLAPENPLHSNATEIHEAAKRAATLTRQLLAYGRKQILQPAILDLNSILSGMESSLRHLMGRGTEVRLVPAAGLKAVQADAGQIEQVIMNLAMNSADAMPKGGKLTLETANVALDQEHVSRFPELKAGDYVMLAITDTGVGMSGEIKDRVFEPFFTTKGVGKGTGLGLSTSYGIVKQSGGHINVESEPDCGAVFKIYLPQVEPPKKGSVPRLASPGLPHGGETILLVDDDPALREMAAALLKRLGYTVLVAANGIEALNLSQQPNVGPIDLLFTDVAMPQMSGKELSERVRVLSPHTRILFTSSYTEKAMVHQGGLNKDVALLKKPFTPSAMAHKVRELLDQPTIRKLKGRVEWVMPTPPSSAVARRTSDEVD